MLIAATLAFALTIGGVQSQSPYPHVDALLKDGKFTEAIAELEKLALTSDDYRLRVLLGRAHIGAFYLPDQPQSALDRHGQGASESFRRALDLAPNAAARRDVIDASDQPFVPRALTHMDDVLALFRLARSRDPEELDYRFRIARLLEIRVDRDARMSREQARAYLTEGIEHLDAVLKATPDHVEALAGKALSLRGLAERVETRASRQNALHAEADKLELRAERILERKKKPR